MKLTHTQAAVVSGFDLASAKERLDRQIGKAKGAARTAVDEAVAVGAMLIEIREALQQTKQSNQHTPVELQFKSFVEEACARNEVSGATLYRWIGAAENSIQAALRESSIDIEALTVPVSALLTMPAAELPLGAQEARQLLFDWMEDKTINECLKGVVVDGDAPHRIKRAHNGKNKGGAGGDRKDWPAFIKQKLAHITSHLEHWDAFTAGQKEATLMAWGQSAEEWPTGALELIGKVIQAERKNR